jgi:hypothetical protein
MQKGKIGPVALATSSSIFMFSTGWQKTMLYNYTAPASSGYPEDEGIMFLENVRKY